MVFALSGPRTPHNRSNPMTEPEANQCISVFVRCRPLNGHEKRNEIELVPTRREVKVDKNIGNRTFTYDGVFDMNEPQISVYKAVVAPLISQVIMGYNCTVFAYGQTGTGKTYTMEGERTEGELNWEDDPKSGIIPRALQQLFEVLVSQNVEHTVRVSFLEIYNEELYDLLSPSDGDGSKMKIYDDMAKKGSVIINGLEEITVHTKNEIYEVMKKGSAKRQTASTQLNARSSRSHTIFSVTVHIKENSMDGEELLKIGKLNLVDLAGSENIGRSGAVDKRAREAGNINQSLLTLGRVITSLVEKGPHIPYRESKLTRLLQDSLGGRTKTSIIATISPASADSEDSLSTLDYASRAKKIMNKPEINQKMTKKSLLREYTNEIERLRRDLQACREKNGFFVDKNNYDGMIEELEKKTEDIVALEEKIKLLTEQYDDINAMFESTSKELQTKTAKLNETTSDLIKTCTILGQTKETLGKTECQLDEHKHLVNVHVEVEKEMNLQAKDLLNVADQTTSDVSKLHSKVERQTFTEMNNFDRINAYQNKFSSNMRNLQEISDMTTGTYRDGLGEIGETMRRNFTVASGKVNSLVDQLSEVNESLTNELCLVDVIASTEEIAIEQNLLKESTSDIQMKCGNLLELVSNNSTQQNDALKTSIESLIELMKGQRAKQEELIMKQNDHLNKLSELHKRMTGAMKENAQQKQQNEIATIDTFEKDMMAYITSFTKTMKDNIMKSSNAEKTCLDEYSRTTNIECNSAISYVNDIDSECLTNFEINSKTMFDICSKQEKDVTESNVAVKRDQLILSEKFEQSKEQCDRLTTLTDGVKVKCIAYESTRDAIKEKCSQNVQTCQDIDSSLDEAIGCYETKMVQLNDDAGTLHKSYCRELNQQAREFERFIRNDLTKCLPTGETPQKTTYEYPRDLKTCSPHEKILSKYRYNRESGQPLFSDSLQEELENVSETDSISSVASSRSNDENVAPKRVPSKVNLKSDYSKVNAPANAVNKAKRQATVKPMNLANANS